MNQITFLKPVQRSVPMFSGQLRVIFEDDTDIVLSVGKRGPVLPRRKRAEARKLGIIK